MDRRARHVLIDCLQIRLFTEDDIGGVFALVHTPVVSGGEVPVNRAAQPCQIVQPFMDPLRFPAVGDLLRPLPVGDVSEGVVGHPVIDSELTQLPRQPVMAIQADLQTAGQPWRHPHVTQTEFFVDEVEVIVQAFAVVGNQVSLSGLFVVPWLVCRAGLHRREDAHQSRVLSAFLQQFLHPVLFAEVPLADEFDFNTRPGCHLLGVLPNPVAERLGELWIVEDPDLSFKQQRCHPSGETDSRQCAENQHPVKTAQHSRYPCGVSLG